MQQLQSIETLRASGRAKAGPGREALVTREVKPPARPHRARGTAAPPITAKNKAALRSFACTRLVIAKRSLAPRLGGSDEPRYPCGWPLSSGDTDELAAG